MPSSSSFLSGWAASAMLNPAVSEVWHGAVVLVQSAATHHPAVFAFNRIAVTVVRSSRNGHAAHPFHFAARLSFLAARRRHPPSYFGRTAFFRQPSVTRPSSSGLPAFASSPQLTGSLRPSTAASHEKQAREAMVYGAM